MYKKSHIIIKNILEQKLQDFSQALDSFEKIDYVISNHRRDSRLKVVPFFSFNLFGLYIHLYL